MEKFQTGNIVRFKNDGYIVIVNKYRTVDTKDGSYDVIDWISFSSANASGITRLENTATSDGEECEYLASNAKEYIIDRLTKNFEF